MDHENAYLRGKWPENPTLLICCVVCYFNQIHSSKNAWGKLRRWVILPIQWDGWVRPQAETVLGCPLACLL